MVPCYAIESASHFVLTEKWYYWPSIWISFLFFVWMIKYFFVIHVVDTFGYDSSRSHLPHCELLNCSWKLNVFFYLCIGDAIMWWRILLLSSKYLMGTTCWHNKAVLWLHGWHVLLLSNKYLMVTICWYNEAVLWLQVVSLMNPSISVDCEILRDCYEAFAMYCFGRYLVACLGSSLSTCVFSLELLSNFA